MKSIETHGTFADTKNSATQVAAKLAIALRKLISDVYPDAFEVAWPHQMTVGYGIGPKKMTEHFCYIGLYKEHVNIGFNHGAALPDPKSLLIGTGKRFRHMTVASADEISRPSLRSLIKAAVKERKIAHGAD